MGTALRSDKARARRQPRKGQLGAVAYARLRQMILECDLPPGAPVSQSRLEEITRLGRAAVRTALARLQQEGLVRPVPRRGYLVSPVTLRDIDDLLGLRLLLEPAALRLAVGRLGEADFTRLRALADIGYTSRDRASERRFLRANRDFHLLIARASGNGRLAQVMEQILGEGTRMLHLTMSSKQNLSAAWSAGHHAICDALQRGDGAAAAEIAAAEIEDGRREILRAVLTHSGVAQTNVFG